MIATVLRVSLIDLRRDRVALGLNFLLPILFFSVFAIVFGQVREGAGRIRVAVVDEAGTEASRRLVETLERDPGLAVLRAEGGAEALVRDGEVGAAIVIPSGLHLEAAGPSVEILSDASNPIVPQVVTGLLHKALLTTLRPQAEDLVAVRQVGLAAAGRASPMISFYAAGVGVMFLLFSAVGAGGSLLEEVESGTLDRVLTTRLGMTGLLVGKWLYLSLLGVVQLAAMFAWGAAVFGLELSGHLTGLALMTVVTSAAAAGFGLVFAASCRTRRQLHGITTIVILLMSALGGSIFPRSMMSETMQKVGLLTFNGWALDGFQKVMSKNASPLQLWPQVAVLGVAAALFLFTARRIARRWE